MDRRIRSGNIGRDVKNDVGMTKDELAQALLERVKEAHEKKDSYGKYSSYIKEEYQDFMWVCQGDQKGTEHLIDIVPYKAGKHHPNLKEGEWAFLLDVYVHRGVGPNEDQYICLARMYNKPCPICEDQKRKRREGKLSEDELRTLSPVRRTLYNIIVYDNEKERSKGVQLWDVSQRFMDRELSTRARNSRTGEFINYAHPSKEIGKSIFFIRKGMGQYNTEFLGHDFVDRERSLTQEDLNQAFKLDEVIKIPTYEEVYEAYYGYPPEEEEVKPRQRFREKEEVLREEVVEVAEAEEETPKLQKKFPAIRTPESSKSNCPAGGVFGRDIGTFTECDTCDLWDDCVEEEKRVIAERVKKRFTKAEEGDEE